MRRPVVPLGLVVAVVFGSAPATGQETKPAAKVADDFVLAQPATRLPESLASALPGIRAESLASHIAFLASPALEGRGLGGRGLDAAAEYAASSLALADIPPLAEAVKGEEARDSYFQPVPLREISGFTGEMMVETRQGDEVHRRSFASATDSLFSPWPPGSLAAPLVFASYGIREEKLGRDDYAGLDARGKVVLVLRGVPEGEPWQNPALLARYDAPKADDRWETKRETAQAAGAAAVLAVEGEDLAKDLAREPAVASFFLPFDAPDEAPPLVRLSPTAARALLAAAGLDTVSARAARPRELPGVTVTLRASGSERLAWSRNVIGFLAGSDPALREEAVVLGAHLDHLGRRGEGIHPGADDNASGVSALIEIARAFAALPSRPKRTVVFAFWTGEEEGKLGSGHYVRHPRWPLARTRAYVNLDMIGHPWLEEELRKLVAEKGLPGADEFLAKVDPKAFTDPGLPLDAAHVEEALRWAGPAAGMTLSLDRTDGTHGGSDYRDFARARVPWIRFFGNFFPGYHEPGDTPANLDPAQVQRMARLAFATAWRLAER
jgi:hypothetical protein